MSELNQWTVDLESSERTVAREKCWRAGARKVSSRRGREKAWADRLVVVEGQQLDVVAGVAACYRHRLEIGEVVKEKEQFVLALRWTPLRPHLSFVCWAQQIPDDATRVWVQARVH